jgi:hypothetical protein
MGPTALHAHTTFEFPASLEAQPAITVPGRRMEHAITSSRPISLGRTAVRRRPSDRIRSYQGRLRGEEAARYSAYAILLFVATH